MATTSRSPAGGFNDGTEAAIALFETNLGMAVLVSMTHSLAMIVAGGTMAWFVYRYLGLRLVAGSWFNLESMWASTLIVVGGLSFAGIVHVALTAHLLRWRPQLLEPPPVV